MKGSETEEPHDGSVAKQDERTPQAVEVHTRGPQLEAVVVTRKVPVDGGVKR